MAYKNMTDNLNNKFDIIIIGGGFAGTWMAQLLNQNFRILIVERKKNQDHYKSSGLLTPKTYQLISKYDNVLRNSIQYKFNRLNVISPSGHKLTSISGKPMFYLIQENFLDKKLQMLNKRRNVTVVTSANFTHVTRSTQNRHIYDIIYTKENQVYKAHASVIIAADGPISSVRVSLTKDSNNLLQILQNKEFLFAYEYLYALKNISAKRIVKLQRKGVYHVWFGTKSKDYGGWFFISNFKGTPTIKLGFAINPRDTKRPNLHRLLLHKLFKYIKYEMKLDIKHQSLIYKYGAFIPIWGPTKKIHEDNIFYIGDAAGFCGSFAADGLKGAFISAMATAKVLNDKGIHNLFKKSDAEFNNYIYQYIEKNYHLFSYYKKQHILKTIWTLPFANWQYDITILIFKRTFGTRLGEIFLKLKEG